MKWLREWREARAAERQALLDTLHRMSETQAKLAEGVLKAVENITATQAKQVEAISAHLSLFKIADTPQPPSTPMTDNQMWADQNGFPWEASPEEQARWIEEHDTDE